MNVISCLVLSSFIYINHVYSFHFVPIKHKVSSCSTSSSSSTSSLFIKNTDVICIGEVLYDCIATGNECNGLSVDEVTARDKFIKYPGGAPANVACALAKLGIRSMFAGAVGDDDDGKELLKILGSCNVETMTSISSLPTRKVMVTRNKLGDRQFDSFWNGKATTEFADCYYSPPVTAQWLVDSAALAVVMGTLGLFPVSGLHEDSKENTASVMKQVATLLKDNTKGNVISNGSDGSSSSSSSSSDDDNSSNAVLRLPMLVIDLNIREVFWPGTPIDSMRVTILDFVVGADIIKLTDMEASWAFGVSADDALYHPDILMPYLKPRVGILVTGGQRGASYCIKGVGSNYMAAYPIADDDIVDTTGAGDSFIATFLAAIAMDKAAVLRSKVGADRALRMACIAGALTCMKAGAIAASPSLQQVISMLIE